jgi:hypothetical protein
MDTNYAIVAFCYTDADGEEKRFDCYGRITNVRLEIDIKTLEAAVLNDLSFLRIYD